MSASSASVADVIPIVCVLKRILSRENEADQGITTMKSTLLDAVNRRFNEGNPSHYTPLQPCWIHVTKTGKGISVYFILAYLFSCLVCVCVCL